MIIIDKIVSNDTLYSLSVIVAVLLASAFIYLLIALLFKRLRHINILNRFRIPLAYLKAPLRLLTPVACMLFILPTLKFKEDINSFIASAVTLFSIASAGWLLIRIVHTARESLLSGYDIDTRDNLQARRVYTQIKVIENIIVSVIVLLTASSILMSFESVKHIGTSLLASAGVLGIVLGFAAQKTLGNFIAGIQIALAQPIRLEDVVIVENEWGWIEEITLTYVVVRIWDLRRLVIPISFFVEKPFQNWTRTSADILGSVFLYADYTVPVDSIRKELTRILENSKYWDKKVNVLQVTNASETAVELRALMSAVDSPTAWDLRCEVREKLLLFLQKNYPESLPKTRIELNKESVKA
jgi:small-conductance mechanosensitive channel